MMVTDLTRTELPASDPELMLRDSLLLLWRRRVLIAGLCVIGALIALIVSILLPKIFEARAAVLAPRESGTAGALGGLVAAVGLVPSMPGVALPSATPNRDMFVGILKSRNVADATVRRFNLKERYRVEFVQDAIKELQEKRARIEASDEGVITVTVEDTDPSVAAGIANFYLEQLDQLVTQYSRSEASGQRTFLIQQVARAKVDLEVAAEALRRFQERHRAIVLQDQTRAAIDAAARLKGEIIAAEVQLQVIRSFATEANPDVVALRRRLEEMKRHLTVVQYGDAQNSASRATADLDRPDFVVPFAKVPEVGVELARLTAEVKVRETVVAVLAQQVEQVRLVEAKDLPVVQVLDRAVPAERHSKPNLLLNAAAAAVLSLLVGVFGVFFVEYMRGSPRRLDVPGGGA